MAAFKNEPEGVQHLRAPEIVSGFHGIGLKNELSCFSGFLRV